MYKLNTQSMEEKKTRNDRIIVSTDCVVWVTALKLSSL